MLTNKKILQVKTLTPQPKDFKMIDRNHLNPLTTNSKIKKQSQEVEGNRS